MTSTNGKTARLLSRLPHFYNPKELEKSFLSLYQTFGENLEQCERDIFEALRAHHAPTAENVGSKGYIAPPSEHGDLDKLYALYLETLGGTSQLVGMNPFFTSQAFDVEKLINTLYEDNDFVYVVLKQLLIETEKELENDPLEEYLCRSIRFKKDEIQGTFVFSLLVEDNPLSKYIASQLSETTKELLYNYDGKGVVDQATQLAVSNDLNEKILKDPFLFQRHYEYFREIPLEKNALLLRNSLNKKFLEEKYTQDFKKRPELFEGNILNLQTAIEELSYSEAPSDPMMNSLQRFNRLLLDHVAAQQEASEINWGFIKRVIPTTAEIRQSLRNRFNNLISSDNTETESFFSQLLSNAINGNDLAKQYENDRPMLRRFLLESIFPYEVKHIYRIYQQRLNALIQVLRKGASTKQGIKDIVAANFGLIGDDPHAQKARELIQIKEFDPVETTYAKKSIALFQAFSILNDNQDATKPKLKLKLLPSQIKAIRNIRIIDKTNNREFTIPLEMKTNDSISIHEDELIYNGVLSTKKLIGEMHELPSRQPVEWEIDAEILSNTPLRQEEDRFGTFGKFGTTKFDDAIFINPQEPVFAVEVLSDKLTYGAFSIVIPWHIDGVTDAFAETKDHPRHMIKKLVSKVKAAGVRVKVSYLQDFSESHELSDKLNFALQGKGLSDNLDPLDDFSIDSRFGSEEVHELNDMFSTSITFGYTDFDSGNTFD